GQAAERAVKVLALELSVLKQVQGREDGGQAVGGVGRQAGDDVKNEPGAAVFRGQRKRVSQEENGGKGGDGGRQQGEDSQAPGSGRPFRQDVQYGEHPAQEQQGLAFRPQRAATIFDGQDDQQGGVEAQGRQHRRDGRFAGSPRLLPEEGPAISAEGDRIRSEERR